MATTCFSPAGRDGMRCSLKTREGLALHVSGKLGALLPDVDGDPQMTGNPTLITNLWAYAKHEKLRRNTRSEIERKHHKAQAKTHLEVAEDVAELASRPGTKLVEAWCSGCFTFSNHRAVRQRPGQVPVSLCCACGTPTLRCAAMRCGHMATRSLGSVRVPRYCAEHRHDIPGFEKSTTSFGRLDDYEQFMVFEKKNFARNSKVAMTTVLAAGAAVTGGLTLAPAIGGAIGTAAGYSGAAATSYGLAFLGGGSIAAGGFGMAGGTAVVAAVGGSLGGAMGGTVTNAYLGEDKSFKIVKLQEGMGAPVVLASGFLTEGGSDWGGWEDLVRNRYPEAPVYRVHWGAKELKALGALLALGAGKAGAGFAARQAVSRASRAAAGRVLPATSVLLARDVAKNPWHTAMGRADRTGVALAGLLTRTDAEGYVLIGHSLGARVMLTAAQVLATREDGPKVDTVHLLGAAVGTKGDLRPLNGAVTGTVYNYYSRNDKVLKFMYRLAQGGSVPAGLGGLGTKLPRVKDRDMTRVVTRHSDYYSRVRLL